MHINHVALKVADIDRSLAFYEGMLGFQVIKRTADHAELSPSEQLPAQIIIHRIPNAIPKPPRTTGLYHAAILLPDRPSLGSLLRHLIAHKVPFQGFADHAVSEAAYLPDPDGNGLELYCDRPRETWQWNGDEIQMTTDPLDLQDLLRDAAPWKGMPASTTIGHMHLHINQLDAAEHFYHKLLGMDMMTSWQQHGVSFLAWQGYHHHLGINIWAGQGAPSPPENAVGLSAFGVVVDDGWDGIMERLDSGGINLDDHVEYPHAVGFSVTDPAGNVVELLRLRTDL